MRIFTENNYINTYTVAPTLKVTESDGNKNIQTIYKREHNYQDVIFGYGGYHNYNISAMLEPGTEATVSANAAKRLIRYRLNSAGEIAEIIFAANNVSSSAIENIYDVTSVSEAEYEPSENKFAGFTYTDSTRFLSTPIRERVNGDFEIDEDALMFINSSCFDKGRTDYAGYI